MNQFTRTDYLRYIDWSEYLKLNQSGYNWTKSDERALIKLKKMYKNYLHSQYIKKKGNNIE